jgi:TolA-binding protein
MKFIWLLVFLAITSSAIASTLIGKTDDGRYIRAVEVVEMKQITDEIKKAQEDRADVQMRCDIQLQAMDDRIAEMSSDETKAVELRDAIKVEDVLIDEAVYP